MNRVDVTVTEEEIRSFFSPFHVYSVRRDGDRAEVEVRDASTVLFEKSNVPLLGKRTFLTLPVASGIRDVSQTRRPVPIPVANNRRSPAGRRRPARESSDFDDVF